LIHPSLLLAQLSDVQNQITSLRMFYSGDDREKLDYNYSLKTEENDRLFGYLVFYWSAADSLTVIVMHDSQYVIQTPLGGVDPPDFR